MATRWLSRTATALAALACCAAAAAPPARAATIVVVNGNTGTEGFNDPTPAAPVGGNTGTTVGQQRLIAFQHAADLWGALLDSPVEIRIRATFQSLPCTATSGALGAAGPTASVMDFPGAPLPGTWYPVALANRIAGTDLIPGTDDIVAQFNSEIGTTGCLEGSSWYYGLDNAHGDGTDLVAVLLHEFAHGLGFISLVDDENGVEFLGSPDVFETRILDTTTNKHWNEMTDLERATSTINSGRVVWDGAAVTAAVPATLTGLPVLTVTSPPDLAGDYEIGTASFGGALTASGISGSLVAAIDPADADGPSSTDACSPLTNAGEVAGTIALVDRGTCFFVDKAARIQAAGGRGIVIVDNVAGTIPPGLGGDDPGVTIPTVSLTQADGNTLRAAIPTGVTVQLGINSRRRAGAGLENRAMLYSPNPVEPGSSTSHWDTGAVPNLLMEPNINDDLAHAVDLTLPLLRDIGWTSDADPGTDPRQSPQEATATRQPAVVARP
jgi:PA domain-containing protein